MSTRHYSWAAVLIASCALRPDAQHPVTSEPDHDQDGIADSSDTCPEVEEFWHDSIVRDGCPDVARRCGGPSIEESTDWYVHFHRDSSTLDVDANLPELERVVAFARRAISGAFLVYGWAASDEIDPMDLSARRAAAVRTWLADRGVLSASLPRGVFETNHDDEDGESLCNAIHECLTLYREDQEDYLGLSEPTDDRSVTFRWIGSGDVLEFVAPRISFDSGSNVPDAASTERLEVLARVLREIPGPEPMVIGHASPHEPNATALALRRAEHVREALGLTMSVHAWVPRNIGGHGHVVFDTAQEARTVLFFRSMGGSWLKEIGGGCPIILDSRVLEPPLGNAADSAAAADRTY